MCRFVSFIGCKPILLSDLLINAPHPITQQINQHYLPANPEGAGDATYNFDGFGVTWYTDTLSRYDPDVEGSRPVLYRTPAIAVTDETFLYVCNNTSSSTILAHVRNATRPPMVASNNHPFVFGRYSLMHNGSITDFPKIQLEMLQETKREYAAMISGNTDSEHFAALYFTYLGDINEVYGARRMRNALAKAIKTVQDIQVQVLGKEVANEMNFCITNGETLVALRWKNNPTPSVDNFPLSLYVSYTAAASLSRKEKFSYGIQANKRTATELTQLIKPAAGNLTQPHYAHNPFGVHVIVASEPATFDEEQWYSVNNGQFVLVDRRKNPWNDIPHGMFTGAAKEAANIEVSFEDFNPENEA